jgi:hypothetical protein
LGQDTPRFRALSATEHYWPLKPSGGELPANISPSIPDRSLIGRRYGGRDEIGSVANLPLDAHVFVRLNKPGFETTTY